MVWNSELVGNRHAVNANRLLAEIAGMEDLTDLEKTGRNVKNGRADQERVHQPPARG